MRNLSLLTIALLSSSASAESLRLDDALLEEANRLVMNDTDASAALPGAMELVQAMSGAGKSGSSNDDSGGGSGGNALAGIGIGLQVGTPTALTFKFGAGNADIVLGIGAGFGYGRGFGGLSLHGDYLFTVGTLVDNGTINLSAYIGPGLWLTFFNADDYYIYSGYFFANRGYSFIGIGARLPLGLDLRFSGAPIEIYLELDPALFIFPGVGFYIGASLGFRWFF